VTLVEAVVGTTLLATVLVSILLTAARLRRQSVKTQQTVTACRIADGLLEGWSGNNGLPRNGSGDVREHRGWRWRTRTPESKQADEMGAAVVSLEILAPDSPDDSPAASVQVLVAGRRRHAEGNDTD